MYILNFTGVTDRIFWINVRCSSQFPVVLPTSESKSHRAGERENQQTNRDDASSYAC
jgi:hypothetical protein